ncbi:EAL domain-containing protein [Sulfurimonas sp. HSL-1716]|uniref:EAL domain-containing protein n=1 Tax=Hydrocurvibacter sulfurireducens TaxID=3131937 RepID=UPI0031F93E85
MKNGFMINEYTISSSSEVENVVQRIYKESKEHVYIQIAAYIHNTVLVHNLTSYLKKNSKDGIEIALLKSKDKNDVNIVVYSSDEKLTKDEILYKLQNKNKIVETDVQDCKVQLLKRFFTDPLTGFPNLYQMRRDMQDIEDRTYICVALDNFQVINDFYGFVVGDYLLEQMAFKLKNNVKNSKVYRISGAEFGILIDEIMDFYTLKSYLKELNSMLKNSSFEYQNNVIYTDVTLASSAGRNFENLFSKVNMALKYAKQMKLPFWIYEDRMNFENEYEQNLITSFKIRKSIENSGVIPYFQPIVSNKTGKIVRFESLARLKDENGNILSPLQFIPIAKTIKVYTVVTKSVIEKTFDIFKDNEFEFSINLSIEDIMSEEIYTFIIERLKQSDLGNRVTFELLESEAIIDYNKVTRFVTEVKRFGAKIAIDDFGSGYSNFSYLTKIQVDYIKIDGMLIKDIDICKNSRLIAQTIVEFAKKMGIETIAEYVHSSTVESVVKELGIDYSQGYYIDEPTPKLPS